jgi:hypothetical protein
MALKKCPLCDTHYSTKNGHSCAPIPAPGEYRDNTTNPPPAWRQPPAAGQQGNIRVD